jgi:hypothetical protein
MNRDFLRIVTNANLRYDLVRVNARDGWPTDTTIMRGYNFPAHHHYHFTFRTDLSPAYRTNGERWFRMYHTVPVNYPANGTPAEMSEWRKGRIEVMDDVTMYDCIGALIERAQMTREIDSISAFIDEYGYFDDFAPGRTTSADILNQLQAATSAFNDSKECEAILREAFGPESYYRLMSVDDWREEEDEPAQFKAPNEVSAIDMMHKQYGQSFPQLNGEMAQASIDDALTDMFHPDDPSQGGY